MAEFAALPIFTDSLLADTGHLTHEEFGAYMRVLILLWRTPECRMPVADAWIMRKLMCEYNKFNELFKPLFSEFLISDGAFYTQKRLLKEFMYVRAKSIKNRGAAKSRWNKEVAPHSGNAPTPTPTPTPNINNSKELFIAPKQTKPRKKTEMIPLPDDWKPNAGHLEKCGRLRHDVNILVEQFRNYHAARATRFANWDAAFYTWIGNSQKFDQPKNKNGYDINRFDPNYINLDKI